mgnify:CR=1 FL=1|tara:strand:- start:1217 stop:1963 length:747 start_codon:yes stop_codon:yes gene_type:complete
MNKKIEIFVRHCFYSSNNVNKNRPKLFSQELCYKNLLRTIDWEGEDSVNVTFILDVGNRNGKKHFIEEGTNKVVEIDAGNDAKSFLGMVEYVENLDLDDDTIVYFLEDDFFHNDGWVNIMREAFEVGSDYVTLYDHKDKYFLDLYDDLESQLFHTKSVHWRTSPSTTNTYAMKFKTFKKHIDIHKKYCDLNDGCTKDHDKFMNLWYEQNSSLISCIPGYSTHMETEYMSPCVHWEDLLEQETNRLLKP